MCQELGWALRKSTHKMRFLRLRAYGLIGEQPLFEAYVATPGSLQPGSWYPSNLNPAPGHCSGSVANEL